MEQEHARPGLLGRHPLVAYFALAYGISWVFWIPLAASSQGLLHLELPAAAFYNLAALGPLLGAIIVSNAQGSRAGVRAFLGGLLRWRVGWPWHLGTLLAYPALGLLALGADLLLGGRPSWPPSDLSNLHMSYGFLLLIMPPFVLGEEIGWRGFALPRLQRTYGPLLATLILGVLWALWHIPSFLMRGSIHEGQPFLVWLLWILAISVVCTWIYNGTGGSVLHTWFFHVSFNYAGFLTPLTMTARMLASGLFLLAVILILILAGPTRLGRRPAREDLGEAT